VVNKMGQEDDVGLLELIDRLILHINSERTWFNILIATSIFTSPIFILFTFYLLLHRKLIAYIFMRDPRLGVLATAYFAIIIIVSLLWLIVGIKEYKFLSKWNRRFRKYFSLKEQLDRELRKEFEEST
jgi:hypothetical protein